MFIIIKLLFLALIRNETSRLIWAQSERFKIQQRALVSTVRQTWPRLGALLYLEPGMPFLGLVRVMPKYTHRILFCLTNFQVFIWFCMEMVLRRGAAGGGGVICPSPAWTLLHTVKKKGIQCHKSEKTNMNLWCKHRNRDFVINSSREVLIKDLRRKGPLHFFALGPKCLAAPLVLHRLKCP